MRAVDRPTTGLALLTAALLALGLAACGGGDSPQQDTEAERRDAQAQAQVEPEARAQNAETSKEYRERQAAGQPTEEEREAKRSASEFYAILSEDKAVADESKTSIDSTSFCELMSEQAVAQTIRYAKVSSGIRQKWDCESAVELLVLRSKRAGGFGDVRKATVIGVNAEGDRATATVRFGNGPATSIPLVKEDGEWKLAATPATPNEQKEPSDDR